MSTLRTEVAEKTYREAIIEAMAEEMRRDARVVLIGEDVGRFGGAMGPAKVYSTNSALSVLSTRRSVRPQS